MSADDLKRSAAAARRLASGIETFVAGQQRAGRLNAADAAALNRAVGILRKSGSRLEGQSHVDRAKEQRYKKRLLEAEKCLNAAFAADTAPEDAILLAATAGYTYSLSPGSVDLWLNPDPSRQAFGRRFKRECATAYVAHLREEALSSIAHRLAGDGDPLKTGGDIASGVAKVRAHFIEKREKTLQTYSYVMKEIHSALSAPSVE